MCVSVCECMSDGVCVLKEVGLVCNNSHSHQLAKVIRAKPPTAKSHDLNTIPAG